MRIFHRTDRDLRSGRKAHAADLRGGETIVLGGALLEVGSAFRSWDYAGLITLAILQEDHPLGFTTVYLIPDEPVWIV